MVLDEICGGDSSWTSKADSQKPTYLHVVTVEPDAADWRKKGIIFRPARCKRYDSNLLCTLLYSCSTTQAAGREKAM
jgi:hypothetical protein